MFYHREYDSIPSLRLSGCLVFSLLIFAGCLLPLLLIDLAQTALTNLRLGPTTALVVLLGILLGSLVNIPIARFPLDDEVLVPVFEPIGGWEVLSRFRRLQREMVVAVNVGGCVIPVLLAVWLLQFIVTGGAAVVAVLLTGMVLNTALCYSMARPIPKIGIALPFFLSAAVALTVTWIGLGLAPPRPYHAPVAFVIGITGPLVGADLLHWKDFKKIAAGTVSIGGAGTWDGIVLSGLLAALLA